MNRQEAKRIACGAASALINVNMFEGSDLLCGIEDLPDVDQDRITNALGDLMFELGRRSSPQPQRKAKQ